MLDICAQVRQGDGISLTPDFVPGGVDFSQVPSADSQERKREGDLIFPGTRAARWSDVCGEGGAS